MSNKTTAKTNSKQKRELPSHLWKPGVSGNPKGRPKGSKQALGEDFVKALQDDFREHGIATLERVREEKPDAYLKVIASIIPKELNVNHNSLEELSDAELTSILDSVRQLVASGALEAARSRETEKTRH
jgi:hypothetical protein